MIGEGRGPRLCSANDELRIHKFLPAFLPQTLMKASMPQIWMTYGEIADLLGCDQSQARAHAAACALDRKKSRDGFTRVKLDRHCMALFFARIRAPNADLDRAIGELWDVHGELARLGPRRSVWR